MKVDLVWTMINKVINFDYAGGQQTQNFKIRGTNLPWTYECEDGWITLSNGATSLTMDVRAIYDFNTRVGTIKVFDRFKNEIDLTVEQTGYYDLSIEMPTTIVLYEGYYKDNDTYDVYLTVYGGPLQMVDCDALKPYIQEVWDNSDMYNDFLLRIPKTLAGTFKVKHSDAKEFKKFCKKHGIKYPQNAMEKNLTIVQVTEEDAIGEMVIKYGGKCYTNRDETKQIDVRYDQPFTIELVSNKFTSVISKTEYKVIKNTPVEVAVAPDWLNIKRIGNKILLQCDRENPFADRYSLIKLVNKENPRQFITINIRQENEA